MIVVDASVLVDALLDDGPAGEQARDALDDDPEWAGPPHLLTEVLSVTHRRVLRGQVSVARAEDAVEALAEIAVTWVDPRALVHRTWALRENVTPFDAGYVAAAELLGATLVTVDRRLSQAPGPRCSIRVLG